MNAATRAGAAPELLAELKHAHAIIKAMLNVMTVQQKAKVHEQLDNAGVSGECMTRANERLAVIEAAEAQAGNVARASATGMADRARMRDIESSASHAAARAADITILLRATFEKLDELSTKSAGLHGELVNAATCFTTCAARNASLITETVDEILELTRQGGAV